MKEPNKIPLNPETPKSKDVNKTPMPALYRKHWDIMPDNDSVYNPTELDEINRTLDKAANEDIENSN